MIKTSIILFVLFYMVSANSQQTIDKLNSNQLKLPKETVQKALSIDSAGQVKSSATSDVELGYLSGVTSSVQTQINSKANERHLVPERIKIALSSSWRPFRFNKPVNASCCAK